MDPFYGPFDLEAGWVPSLRYLMRRARLLEIFKTIQPSALLEVGCGAGGLLVELSRYGFDCVGLETSKPALMLARRITGNNSQCRIVDAPHDQWTEKFMLVAAFDVLEHIENDVSALQQWRNWICKSGGKLLLSVPAHTSRWGPGDIWAGHYRRYDAEQLQGLLNAQGFEIEYFECYGFPVANFTEWAGRRGYARMLAGRTGASEKKDATALSGVERGPYLLFFRYMRMMPVKWFLKMCFLVQKIFRKTDWGSGYIVLARKI